MVNWGDRIRQAVIDLLVKGIEVASEQGQNLLTATASIYLAYMSAMWLRRVAHTATVVWSRAMGGGVEAERQLIPDPLGIQGNDPYGPYDDGEARTSGQNVVDEFAGDDEYFGN